MGLETGSYINDLVTTNPVGGSDPKSEGDDHIRLLKSTLKATFPGMAGRAWRQQAKSGDYTLQTTDNMSWLSCSTTLTISGTAATLGNGFAVFVQNTSTTTAMVTLPTATILRPDEGGLLLCTGSTFAFFPTNRRGYQLFGAQTLSGSSVTFTGFGSLPFTEYYLIANVSCSDATLLRIRSGSGSIDTGNNYNYRVDYGTNAQSITTTTLGFTGTAAINFSGVNIGASPQANYLTCTIKNYGTRLQMVWHNIVVGSDLYQVIGMGTYSASGTIDRIQLFLDAGTFSGGSVSIYGLG